MPMGRTMPRTAFLAMVRKSGAEPPNHSPMRFAPQRMTVILANSEGWSVKGPMATQRVAP